MFVERFVSWAESATIDERAAAIGDVAATYLDPESSERDRTICERIFTLFLDDPSAKVRAAMARVLAPCENAPRALIWNLSNDIPEVSAVIYEHSTTMCRRTLIDAIETGSSAVQCAIARRAEQDTEIVHSLLAHGKPAAVLHLLRNGSVILGPNLKHEIAGRLGYDPDIRGHLLDDEDLAAETRQMLVLQLTAALTQLAADNNWLDAPRLQQVANDSKNRATIDITTGSDVGELISYVEHLRSTDQLTCALLLRSICMGSATFFEVAIAQLSGSSVKRVQSIVDEGRLSAFKSLYKRTGLSPSAYKVFAAAITVWKQFGASITEAATNEAFVCEQAVNEILSRIEDDASVDASLLSMLRRLSAEAARECARTGAPQALLTAA